MKTAEEYYIQARNFFCEIPNSTEMDIIELAINEARIDCINECAEAVDLFDVMNIEQSILKLKEQIK